MASASYEEAVTRGCGQAGCLYVEILGMTRLHGAKCSACSDSYAVNLKNMNMMGKPIE